MYRRVLIIAKGMRGIHEQSEFIGVSKTSDFRVQIHIFVEDWI